MTIDEAMRLVDISDAVAAQLMQVDDPIMLMSVMGAVMEAWADAKGVKPDEMHEMLAMLTEAHQAINQVPNWDISAGPVGKGS